MKDLDLELRIKQLEDVVLTKYTISTPVPEPDGIVRALHNSQYIDDGWLSASILRTADLSGYVTSPVSIAHGGTGAITAALARVALGLEIGIDVQAQSNELTAIAAISSGGLLTRIGSTWGVRTITGTSGNVALTNGDGVLGNPVVNLITTGVSGASYGSATQVATFTVDAYGRLTAASNTTIAITESQVTNLTTDLAAKQSLDATLTAFAGLTITQGSLIVGTGTDAFSVLAKDTNSTRYLSNTGSSNTPAWAQVDLTNGVTGILSSSTGGSGVNNGSFTLTYPATGTATLKTGTPTANCFPEWTDANTITSTGRFYRTIGGYDLTIDTLSGENVDVGLRINSQGTLKGRLLYIGATGAFSFNNYSATNIDFVNQSTGVFGLSITSDGRVYGTALHNNAGAVTGTTNQYVASGTYTPTLTGVTNVAASTAFASQWTRVGSVVTVSGYCNIDPTTANITTNFRISLPIASDLTASNQLAGSAVSQAVAAQCWGIYGDVTNNTALVEGLPPSAANNGVNYIFTYVVV